MGLLFIYETICISLKQFLQARKALAKNFIFNAHDHHSEYGDGGWGRLGEGGEGRVLGSFPILLSYVTGDVTASGAPTQYLLVKFSAYGTEESMAAPAHQRQNWTGRTLKKALKIDFKIIHLMIRGKWNCICK